MKIGLYAVKDTKVGAFMPPFVARARGEAVRSFQAAIQDGTHAFAKFPADYELWQVGEFDDAHGELMPRVPDRIIGGNEF